MGQHCRVGIEDNIWNSKRERMTTLQQIEAVVSLAERFGRKVATADEAREIMKIGVWYDSVDETLQNLGMAPNRGDDDRGFMVWETDGKKSVEHAMSDSHPMAYCMVPPDMVSNVSRTTIAIKVCHGSCPAWGRNLRIEQNEADDERISDTL